MIPHKQRFLHDPTNGSFGDCDRTVMACVLELSPDDVPNWGVHHDNYAAFMREKDDWLASVGLVENSFAFECSREEMENNLKLMFRGMYVFLTGTSANGTHHVVITLNGAIIHDPAIDNSGIVGPCDDGYWWVSFLVPRILKEGRSNG